MDRVRLLIVEDDALIAEDLKVKLERLGYMVMGICDEGEDVPAAIEEHDPDVILMDIRLAGAWDGIDTAERVLESRPELCIIYLTDLSDPRTWNRAKHTRPKGYIVKPYHERQLSMTLEMALLYGLEEGQPPAESNKTLEEVDHAVLKDRIFVKENTRFFKIDLTDIWWLEAERSYSAIVMENKRIVLSISLNHLAEKIDASYFMRTHRSFFINTQHIEAIEGNRIFIHGQEVPLGKTYRDDFLRKFRFV